MHRHLCAPAILLAAVASGFVAAGCSGGKPPGASTSSAVAKGKLGQYFYVNIFTPPIGGVLTSTVGGISCGASSLGTPTPDAGGVLQHNPVYYGPGTTPSWPTVSSQCGVNHQTQVAWSDTVILTATPLGGNAFLGWAGDCSGQASTCTLSAGADKTVVAIFGSPGSGHPNFTDPALHGPAYLDFLGSGASAPLVCTRCHGDRLQGQGIAPSCNGCHQAAGWTSWQTNCSFCHGTRSAATRPGYGVAQHPTWSAPPDAISQRLNGVAVPDRTGAHQAHLSGNTVGGLSFALAFQCETCHPVPADLGHVRGASARAIVALSGTGQAALPNVLGSYDQASGACSTYCHGSGKLPGLSPAWTGAVTGCASCHPTPPASAPAGNHPNVGSDLTVCRGCHAKTMNADGTLDVAGGFHLNGQIDASGGACNSCHGYPPATGAHAAHFGLTGTDATGGYGETTILQDRYPVATPTGAPGVYAFGCGLCHPTDYARHRNGSVDVTLYEATATGLKALAAPGASYDRASETCSGVYCHSSGQQSPAFAATPAWTSTAPLGCGGCHGNPPRYPTGGAGAVDANSHLYAAPDLTWGGVWAGGHYAGLGGLSHANAHAGAFTAGDTEAVISCQTCHYDTTDPGHTGPSGFYYLDTSGDYLFPGVTTDNAQMACNSCHTGAGYATQQGGKVLPLRHVNGTRDVVFDPRDSLPSSIPYLPAAPNTPTLPYWRSNAADSSIGPWASQTLDGTTGSFSVKSVQYDGATKTCSNIACHSNGSASLPFRWGDPPTWDCAKCHPY